MSGNRRESLSPDFYQAAYAQQTGKVFLHLIDVKIDHPTLGTQVFHFVDDYDTLTFDDGEENILYQPASFETTLGADSNDMAPEVKLSFDSGDTTIIRRLREANSPPKVFLSVVMTPKDTDAVISYREIGPMELQARDFTFTSTLVSMTLVIEPVLSEPAPSAKMTPRLAPLLWQNTPVNG
jgi:hypothetical protein